MKKIVSAVLLCAFLMPLFMAATAQAQTGYTIELLKPIGNRNIFYGGAVIDVKFKLFNDGTLVTDATATLWINNDQTPATGRGQFNTGNFFTIQNQNYIFKLDSSPLPAGFGSTPTTLIIIVTVDGEQVATTSTTISLH